MNEHEARDFLNIHTPGLSGIFKIYTLQLIRDSNALRFSLVFTLFMLFLIWNSENFYPKEFLFKVTDMIMNSFPDLLGFNLGCYALIIGLGNSTLLNALTKPIGDKKYSLYQKTIAVFAFSIILQTIVLLSSFCINFFKDYRLLNKYTFNSDIDQIVNCALIVWLIFTACWAIALILNLTINIFGFGQSNHFFLRIEEIKLKNKEMAFRLEQQRKEQGRKKKKEKKK